MTEPSVAPMRWRVIQSVKRGNRSDQLEDAYAADPIAGRFAVADGVTDSSFPEVFAKLLVDRYVANPPATPADWPAWLDSPRAAWHADIRQRPLPWYSAHKFTMGAAATFIGLQIHRDGAWQADAIGDACLFHLRGDCRLLAFPIDRSVSFGRTPDVTRSIPEAIEAIPVRRTGQWQPGDSFVLVTDAMAQWMLQSYEQEGSPTSFIESLLALANDRSQIDRSINGLRESGLHNDDVTLVKIET